MKGLRKRMALYPSESEKINMKSIFQKITIQKVV